jgi:hypothetical protein
MSLLNKLFKKGRQEKQTNPSNKSFFEIHRDKIYPWVKVFFTGDGDPRNTAVQIELKGEDEPIKREWLGDLGILYVADMGDRFQILLKRDLPNEVTEEKLHQLAVDNLNRDIEFRLHETNFGGHGLIAGGNHEAGSICLPNLWEWLVEYFNDSLIVAVPAKDLVMMVAESDKDKIANLKIFVHEIFKDGEKLLTKNIFRFGKETKTWSIVDNVN